jgi:hypothetical protein
MTGFMYLERAAGIMPYVRHQSDEEDREQR